MPVIKRNKIQVDIEELEGIPDEIYDKLDAIAKKARDVFGPSLQPNIRQEKLMEEAGFKVVKGSSVHSVWRTGVIVTPHGNIIYR